MSQFDEYYASMNAERVAAYLQKSIQDILPEHTVKVSGKGVIKHNDSIHIVVYGPEPNNNIPENSPSFMRFMMHLANGRGGALDKLDVNRLQGPRSVKYRKVWSKKSIDDVAAKLVKWFQKNHEAIKELEK